MDQLKSGIGLRGLGGQDPAAAYAHEGFAMFELMIASIQEEFVKFCYNVTLQTSSERRNVTGEVESRKDEFDDSAARAEAMRRQAEGGSADLSSAPAAAAVPDRERKQETVRRDRPKVGRNDPCPCGSGKKFKKCHGMYQ